MGAPDRAAAQTADGLFDGILEAMTALRARHRRRKRRGGGAARGAHAPGHSRGAEGGLQAHRRRLRRVALRPRSASVSNAKARRGAADKAAKRTRSQATWIPWTNSRLAYRSGYGAGVTSPGWYEHLWTTADGAPIRWMTRAAQLLRSEGLDASSASVIEAVRLAEALAAMRDLPMPGLAEMHEATQTVLCNGDAAPHDADPREAGDRRGDGRGPAGDARRAAAARPGGAAAAAAPPADDRRSSSYDLDLRNDDRPRAQPAAPPAAAAGHRGASHNAHSDKPGTFHEYWRSSGRSSSPSR